MYTSSLSYTSGPGSSSDALYVKALLEKGSGRVNEDAQLIAPGLYGVFDGATSLSGPDYNGQTGGQLAAKIAAEVFRRNDRSLKELAVIANRAIREKMVASGVDLSCKEELWSTSIAVVRYRGEQLEWCQTGDCRIQIIYTDGSTAQLVEPPDHDAETLCLWQSLAAVSNGSIYDLLSEKLLEVRRRMNIDYGVLNGETEAIDFLCSGSLPLADVSAVLLHTDGLNVPDQQTGQHHDPALLSRLFANGGLEAVHSHIKILQESDPYCQRYPRFKTSDDISAIALYQSYQH